MNNSSTFILLMSFICLLSACNEDQVFREGEKTFGLLLEENISSNIKFRIDELPSSFSLSIDDCNLLEGSTVELFLEKQLANGNYNLIHRRRSQPQDRRNNQDCDNLSLNQNQQLNINEKGSYRVRVQSDLNQGINLFLRLKTYISSMGIFDGAVYPNPPYEEAKDIFVFEIEEENHYSIINQASWDCLDGKNILMKLYRIEEDEKIELERTMDGPRCSIIQRDLEIGNYELHVFADNVYSGLIPYQLYLTKTCSFNTLEPERLEEGVRDFYVCYENGLDEAERGLKAFPWKSISYALGQIPNDPNRVPRIHLADSIYKHISQRGGLPDRTNYEFKERLHIQKPVSIRGNHFDKRAVMIVPPSEFEEEDYWEEFENNAASVEEYRNHRSTLFIENIQQSFVEILDLTISANGINRGSFRQVSSDNVPLLSLRNVNLEDIKVWGMYASFNDTQVYLEKVRGTVSKKTDIIPYYIQADVGLKFTGSSGGVLEEIYLENNDHAIQFYGSSRLLIRDSELYTSNIFYGDGIVIHSNAGIEVLNTRIRRSLDEAEELVLPREDLPENWIVGEHRPHGGYHSPHAGIHINLRNDLSASEPYMIDAVTVEGFDVGISISSSGHQSTRVVVKNSDISRNHVCSVYAKNVAVLDEIRRHIPPPNPRVESIFDFGGGPLNPVGNNTFSHFSQHSFINISDDNIYASRELNHWLSSPNFREIPELDDWADWMRENERVWDFYSELGLRGEIVFD